MSKFQLIATSAFGLESIVADELKELGFTGLKTETGRIYFSGDYSDMVRCNLWLRCADRVLIGLAEFDAHDFEDLYQGTLSVPWENFIPENGKMHVVGKSVKSKLHSVPDCQSIVKKAVIEAMKRKYRRTEFREDGPVYKIEISLLNDKASLTIDTSGAGLHKRGYAESRNEAPLRETLAAALIKLSRWDPSRILIDPLCGSGTIVIEAASAGRNIAPGLKRNFVSETWPSIPGKIWNSMRAEAESRINDVPLDIYASDMDAKSFRQARINAEKAGLADIILFEKKPLGELSSKKSYGCVITNPPYGERLGTKDEAAKLYRSMGKVFSGFDTWSFFILSAHPEFQKHFGRKADKNRKLYNGKIKCYLYQYYGPLPGRRDNN